MKERKKERKNQEKTLRKWKKILVESSRNQNEKKQKMRIAIYFFGVDLWKATSRFTLPISMNSWFSSSPEIRRAYHSQRRRIHSTLLIPQFDRKQKHAMWRFRSRKILKERRKLSLIWTSSKKPDWKGSKSILKILITYLGRMTLVKTKRSRSDKCRFPIVKIWCLYSCHVFYGLLDDFCFLALDIIAVAHEFVFEPIPLRYWVP